MDRVMSMRVFARVVELGGLAAAARALGLSPAMVAKHVNSLEERTGARLLDRTTRLVRPTVSGHAYYERILAILDALDDADAEAGADTAVPRGRLRLTAPAELGQEHVAPIIIDFMELYPNVSIASDFTNRQVDLVQEGFDLAVRVASSLDTGLIGRKLATSRFFVVASPGLVAKTGLPETPEALARLPTLTFAVPAPRLLWTWDGPDKGQVRIAPRLVSSSSEALRMAARRGVGFTWLPSFVCGRDLAAGDLVPVMTDRNWGSLSVYALYPHRRFVPNRLRLFLDLIAERFGGDPDGDPWLPNSSQPSRG
ncbi:LysR family transcriptional regulator [Pleomorphomonas diazotrophica]|uniref:LysR family transcriptional regulator n=2 Tax=Pleomorphomonas diazotrophica TaxID=1166257 RepID=A0A2N3LT88_9HYPH|nr:LysR family transcriptional regulator [Pleomorphomonas diazotrophica]